MNISIGTDIEEIKRFENKDLVKDKNFLDKIFTAKELDYCFKTQNNAQHMCARFCAKESVIKALSEFGISDVYYKDIEILNRENGAPYVELIKYPDLKIKISISHCKTYSTATALIIKE